MDRKMSVYIASAGSGPISELWGNMEALRFWNEPCTIKEAIQQIKAPKHEAMRTELVILLDWYNQH
jgi:hypothetical protein